MEILKEFLFQTYQFLASIKVPGFDISFLQLFLGVFSVVVSLSFAKMFFGLGGDVVSSIKQRGGNNNHTKIPEERKGDTK